MKRKTKRKLDIKLKPLLFCFIFYLHRKVTYGAFRPYPLPDKLLKFHEILSKVVNKRKKTWSCFQRHFIIMCSSILVNVLKMDSAYKKLFYEIIREIKKDDRK